MVIGIDNLNLSSKLIEFIVFRHILESNAFMAYPIVYETFE